MVRPLPVLMHAAEVVGMKQAMAVSRRSESTVRRWCKLYGLARQAAPSAPLEISRVGLEMVLHGDFGAIEMLRAGRRSDPAVRRYINHLGLSDDQT